MACSERHKTPECLSNYCREWEFASYICIANGLYQGGFFSGKCLMVGRNRARQQAAGYGFYYDDYAIRLIGTARVSKRLGMAFMMMTMRYG
jgi:hypothetical protein